MFNPNDSLLAGMPRAQLEAALTAAQNAYLALSEGQQGVSFSYSQGDGTRSVTYKPTDIAQLSMLIRQLQAQLGIIRRPRRAMGFRY